MPVPPSPNPINRRPRVGPLVLPREGRRGDIPQWPIDGEPTEAEARCWAQLWATPQAVAWEQLGWTRTVARYCRALIWAENPEASAASMSVPLNLEDRLGLTPKAMRMLLWTIGDSTAPVVESSSDGEDELARRRRLLGKAA